MCGIIGTINIPIGNIDLNLLRHRGPDKQDIIKHHIGAEQLCLGQTRLAIVDLSPAGNQPMGSICGRYILVFNGEIYNHLDLRKKIPSQQFKGHSDTETILYYLIRFGKEGLKDLNGIFSLGLLDKNKGTILLARDPFGVKPLYYYHKEKRFIFSSELKPITKYVKPQVEINHLITFLRLRYNPSPQTLLKEIYKLEPGHYLEVKIDGVKIARTQYFAKKPSKIINITEEDALEQYEKLLRKAVKRQLMADVPISILLSGGVDSALLTKIALEESNQSFQTFTAGYDRPSEIDELEDAAISAKYLGVKQTKVILNEEEFVNIIPHLVSIIEEPLGTQSIFPFYFLCKSIHESGYKVALSGQGVDEPWGGYPKYNPQHHINKLAPILSKFSFLKPEFKDDQLRRGINAITTANRLERFIEIGSVFDNHLAGKLLKDTSLLTEGNKSIHSIYTSTFNNLQLESFGATEALMLFDSRMNLSDDLLLYTDKLSMRHSLEVRVPFLDIELMQFVESLPSKLKVNLFNNKILHKRLAEKFLPKEIIYRKKKHFATPRKKWFKGNIGIGFEAMILADNGSFSDIFNKKFISELFRLHRQGKVNYEKQLFQLIGLFFWYKNIYK